MNSILNRKAAIAFQLHSLSWNNLAATSTPLWPSQCEKEMKVLKNARSNLAKYFRWTSKPQPGTRGKKSKIQNWFTTKMNFFESEQFLWWWDAMSSSTPKLFHISQIKINRQFKIHSWTILTQARYKKTSFAFVKQNCPSLLCLPMIYGKKRWKQPWKMWKRHFNLRFWSYTS